MASASSLSLKLLSSLQTLPALPTYIANLSPSQRIIAGYATAAIATIYVLLVRALRYRRYNALHAKYAEKARNRTLTPTEAQKVVQLAFAYDMPKLSEYSLAFALFKTYAIPTISGLLLATRQLSSQASVARRYADVHGGPHLHMGRLPYHGKARRRAGRRAKGRSARGIGHRARKLAAQQVQDLQRGLFVHFGLVHVRACQMGSQIRMAPTFGSREIRILYLLERNRPSHEHHRHPIYARSVPGMDSLIRNNIHGPRRIQPRRCKLHYGRAYVPRPGVTARVCRGVRAGDVGRPDADRYDPKAPGYANAAMSALLGVVAFTERHLLLPRWRKSQVVQSELPKLVGGKDGVAPRMHPGKWTSRPWYKPIGRGPVGYLRDRAQVLLNWHDDVPKPEYRSEGYRLHEMGPLKFENEGHDEVMRMAADIQGCPVAPGWTAERAQRAEGLKK